MAYKSLISVLSSVRHADAPLAQLVALAEAGDAHAEVLCLGVDRMQPSYTYGDTTALVIQETLHRAETEAQEIHALAQRRLEGTDIRWSAETDLTQLADVARHVAMRARFADLMVAARPYAEGLASEAPAIVEAALFDARIPVLVVPEGATPMQSPKRVMAAWNESGEALAAIRRALPFLQAADCVRIVVVDPPRHGPERSDPGGMLAQMLSRQGVRCEIDVLAQTMDRTCDVLIRHAVDTEADMMVMGAYGHSRFREAILGGVTREMLAHAQIPVLMAH